MFENGFPREWSTIKKLAWLFRSVINAVIPVLKTVTGNPIHITDALAKPVQALSIALEPIQDLHGYDNPWPGGGGKNLLDPDERTNAVQNIHFYQANGFLLKANQAYTFSVYSSENAAGLYIHKLSDNSNLAVKYNVKTVTYTPTEDVMVWFDVYYATAPSGGISGVNCQLELGSSSTAWSPYSNICPITGHSSVNVIVSPTLNPLDGTITNIPLGTTVYGGTLDVLTGVLTVTHICEELTASMDWNTYTSSGRNIHRMRVQDLKTAGHTNDFELSHFKKLTGDVVPAQGEALNRYGNFYNFEICLEATTTLTEWKQYLTDQKNAGTPVQLWHYIDTPQTYQLTPTEVTLLLGENNLWSDSNGDLTLTYYADGNASEIEALNILLGNRYYNNHEADEPSDREALDIVLGGKK